MADEIKGIDGGPSQAIREWTLPVKPSDVVWKGKALRREEKGRTPVESEEYSLTSGKVMQLVLSPNVDGGAGERSGVLRVVEVQGRLWAVTCKGATGLKPKAIDLTNQVAVGGFVLRVGLSDDNDLQLSGGKSEAGLDSISRYHARITIKALPGKGYRVRVVDGSMNGTSLSVTEKPREENESAIFFGVMGSEEVRAMANKITREVTQWEADEEVPSSEMISRPMEPGKVYEVVAGRGKFRVARTEHGVVITKLEPGSATISMDNESVRANNDSRANYRFGRLYNGNSIWLDDASVSSHHGSIGFTWKDGGPVVSVRDGFEGKKSTNGTRLREAEIPR